MKSQRPWLTYSDQSASRIRTKIERSKKLSDRKLAEALNVTEEEIHKILDGKENLSLETFYKLSKVLRIKLITFPPLRGRRK